MKNLKYILFGLVFGIILQKSEVISWFRIQEMFYFQSFHMYGIIGSAIVVGIISVQLIKRFNIKDTEGKEIDLTPKPFQPKANFIGGAFFGLGWAMTGACPGPLFTLLGAGNTIIIIPIISALIGAFVYGAVQDKLPH